MPETPVPKLNAWTIDRAGPGIRVVGIDDATGDERKITNLHRAGMSLSGQIACFDKDGVVKCYLDDNK